MAEPKQAKFTVRIKPNARQSQATGFKDGVLGVRIAAPPIEGKANDALIKFLSEFLGVSKSRLTIEKGLTSRTKTISVQGLNQTQAQAQLEKLTG